VIGMKEIAKLTGVSVSTVSNVLNGRTNVSQKTRERILQCCSEYGYSLPPGPKKTNTDKADTVLFIFSDFDRDFYLKIIEGINDCLMENGYDLIVCTNRSSQKLTKRSFVRGAICLDGSISDEIFTRMARQDFPAVLMDRVLPSGSIHVKSVIVDNYPVMCDMVQTLVDKGYRKFGFLGGLNHTLDHKERYTGFTDTLKKNGIPFDPKYYFHGNYRERSGYQAAKLMILSQDYPEVLVCANDNMAFGVMKAFEEHQIRVPEDIAVTGFDDSDAAAMAGLTTVTIPRYESGYLAAKELLEMIQGKADKAPFKIQASIVWRNSVR